MEITKHAAQRMKERCGFNKNAQMKMAKKAFEHGIAHAQTKGRLNKFITALYFKNPNASNIRIYGDYAYIFCKDTLVTLIYVPSNIRKDVRRMIKKT